MATVDVVEGTGIQAGSGNDRAEARPPKSREIHFGEDVVNAERNVQASQEAPRRENFIPVTRFALIDRLTVPKAWPNGQAADARRFFNYLDYWRHQQHNADTMDLEQAYEPFSPDTDMLLTREFTADELEQMQSRVIGRIRSVLEQANYECIKPTDVELIMTTDSHYGLDLHVDFDVFEEIMIYYRGASQQKSERRRLRKFFFKEEFDVRIYKRLFLLFKLKPVEKHIEEVMASKGINRKEAKKFVKAARSQIPAQVGDENIYMKLFKNIPRSDVEMIFPNTAVKFRLLDKVKLGVTSAGGFAFGAFTAAGKILLLASNPIAAAGAVAGLGAVVFRNAMNFFNTKQRYMVVMAQNLYFHSMADNRGAMVILADVAAEEDIKEEILLYSVLAKERVHRSDIPDIDEAIEKYLLAGFDVDVDFDVEDALSRLLAEGIVTQDEEGYLTALPPAEAAKHLDAKWDVFLDNLPDPDTGEGHEIDAGSTPLPKPPA